MHLDTFIIETYWIFIKMSIISQSDTCSCTFSHATSDLVDIGLLKAMECCNAQKQQGLSKLLMSNTSTCILFCTR